MKTNNILAGILILGTTLIATVASAQYYDPNYNYNNSYNYNYQQPYGITSFGGYTDPYYYNNNYNNYQVPVVSLPSPCYYTNGYTGCGSNYNYYNNYQALYPTTSAAGYVSPNSATINGSVSVSGGNNYYSNNYGTAWFQYGTNGNLNQSTNPATIYGTTNINANLTNLQCGVTYYFRAVTSGQNGLQYGSTLSFVTPSCYNNYYQNYYYPNNYNYPVNVGTRCSRGYKWRR